MRFISSLFFLYMALCFLPFLSCKTQQKIYSSTGSPVPLLQADPTIFFTSNTYYLYGTNGGNADSGFKVFTSKDLVHFTAKQADNGYALIINNHVFGSKGFWAPQVFFYHDKYYIAYTANEHIGIAESNLPTGLFTQTNPAPLDTSIKEIDPFVFFDTDGKIYLYHVRLQNGNRIFIEQLNADLSVKPNTLQACISGAENEQPWENTQHTDWPVTEGPTVIKRNGLYYLFYSANDFRNPDYAVGYATAKTPYGPWKKYENNPIINRQLLGANGTGHGDVLTDKKGNIYYVFHTHNSNQQVSPRKTAILQLVFAEDGSVSAVKSSFRFLQLYKQ